IEDPPGLQAAKASPTFTSLNLAALPIRWTGKAAAKEVRTEFAEWDSTLARWKPPLRQETSIFRRDGQLEQSRDTVSNIVNEYNNAGQLLWIEITEQEETKHLSCTYDANQRLVRVAEEASDDPQQNFGAGFSITSH